MKNHTVKVLFEQAVNDYAGEIMETQIKFEFVYFHLDLSKEKKVRSRMPQLQAKAVYEPGPSAWIQASVMEGKVRSDESVDPRT